MTQLDDATVAWSFGEGDALQEIAAWMEARPGWQQQALRWLLDDEQLTDPQLNELLDMALEQRAAAEPVRASELRMAGSAAQAVALCAVDEIAHVNALAAGQRLTFSQTGLTVIYGRNGAGKSGYARVLKHACRARRRSSETILPSIDDPTPGRPTARIKCSVNGTNQFVQWVQSQETEEVLSAVSVFDSSTAPIHVDEINEVAYTPYPLELLERLASASIALRERAASSRRVIESQTPRALKEPPTSRETSVGQLLASLNDRTMEAQVRALAGLTPAQSARLDALRRDLAGDPRKVALQLRTVRTDLLAAKDRIEALANGVSPEAVAMLYEAHRQRVVTRQAADLAAATDFADEPLPGVGTDAWQALWEAARRYATKVAYPDRDYPMTEAGDRCVLCYQNLAPDAAARLRRFEAFVRDDTEARARAALQLHEDLQRNLADAQLSSREMLRLRSLIDQLGADETGTLISRCLAQLRWNVRRVLRDHPREPPRLVLADAGAATAELDHLTTDLEKRAGALLSEVGSEERRRLETEVRALADQDWLSSVVDDVVAEIGRKREITVITRVERECATNAITQKASELTERLVTGALRKRFQDEIQELGIGYAGVELKRQASRSGVPRFQVKFIRRDDAPVGRVLSEGEFRAVALAAFLAELATAGGNSGIIFDDPVSSLDNEHRAELAKRLVREARHRQVIVFTHDIAFVLLIDRVCVEEEAPRPTYRTISRGTEQIGVCRSEAPYHARAVLDVLGAIERDLENRQIRYDRGEEHEWRIAVRSYQDQLRECWERSVEEFVAPVVKRLSDKVHTRGLEKLVHLTEDACDRMRRGYRRCSELLHSAPDVLNPPLPSPDKIRAEIVEIREWYHEWCEGR